MQKAKNFLTQLKKDGERITTIRRVILYTLEKIDSPLSAYEILGQINDMGLATHKTTIYRELDFFLKKNIIESIPLRGREQHYALCGEHYHYLVCTQCTLVQKIPLVDDLDETENKIYKKFNFKAQSRSLVVYGLCANCQNHSQTIDTPPKKV